MWPTKTADSPFFRQRFHRQGAQLVNAHGGIVMFRRTCFLALIPPRRIGVNDVVSFLLYFLDGWLVLLSVNVQ